MENKIKKEYLKEPFVMLLIGAPLSGKSLLTSELAKSIDFDILSRDNIVLDLGNGLNYNDSFKSVDQKMVDKILNGRLYSLSKTNGNVVVDMTNMTRHRRKLTLNYFQNHYKYAVVFPHLSDAEYMRRNAKRLNEECKEIPMEVIHRMISSYETIDDSEKIDKIFSI